MPTLVQLSPRSSRETLASNPNHSLLRPRGKNFLPPRSPLSMPPSPAISLAHGASQSCSEKHTHPWLAYGNFQVALTLCHSSAQRGSPHPVSMNDGPLPHTCMPWVPCSGLKCDLPPLWSHYQCSDDMKEGGAGACHPFSLRPGISPKFVLKNPRPDATGRDVIANRRGFHTVLRS